MDDYTNTAKPPRPATRDTMHSFSASATMCASLPAFPTLCHCFSVCASALVSIVVPFPHCPACRILRLGSLYIFQLPDALIHICCVILCLSEYTSTFICMFFFLSSERDAAVLSVVCLRVMINKVSRFRLTTTRVNSTYNTCSYTPYFALRCRLCDLKEVFDKTKG